MGSSLVPCTATRIGWFPSRWKLWVDIEYYKTLVADANDYRDEAHRLRAALDKAARIWRCYESEPERAADKMATVVMLALERPPETVNEGQK